MYDLIEMKMTPVKKIGQSCVLACFESFFKDYGYDITQLMLINYLMTKCLCTYDGVVFEIDKVSRALGLNHTRLNSILPVPAVLDKTQSIFVLLNGESKHCVRFYMNLTGEDKLVAMDPDWDSVDKLAIFDKTFLDANLFTLHLIEIPALSWVIGDLLTQYFKP